MKIDLHEKKWQWAALLLLSFLWGSSFILMKKGLQSYSSQQVAAFRIFFSFLAFIPFSLLRIKKIRKDNIGSLLLVGIVGTTIPAFLFTKAQTQIDSSLAGLLNSLAPVFTLLLGLVLYNSKATLHHALGIILGFLGAVGLIVENPFSFNLAHRLNLHGLYVVLATFCYGINANHIKYKIRGLSGFDITSLSFILVGPMAGIYLLSTDFSAALETPDHLLNLGYVAMLAVFCSVIALVIFYTLIQYVSALFATSVTYIIPVFALMWGFLDGEKLYALQVLWISLIFLGVYMVNKPVKPPKRYKITKK
ncbi:MAG: DMT family transporter [Bacteroidales bacterium]|jgi:drug/metabolite transporter (DMT)-like permease